MSDRSEKGGTKGVRPLLPERPGGCFAQKGLREPQPVMLAQLREALPQPAERQSVRRQHECVFRQRLVAARGGPVTRHMMSTIRIERIDATRARGISYVTIYQGPAPDGTAAVVAPDLRIVGEYHDLFEQTADGWKIMERRFRPVLQPTMP